MKTQIGRFAIVNNEPEDTRFQRNPTQKFVDACITICEYFNMPRMSGNTLTMNVVRDGAHVHAQWELHSVDNVEELWFKRVNWTGSTNKWELQRRHMRDTKYEPRLVVRFANLDTDTILSTLKKRFKDE